MEKVQKAKMPKLGEYVQWENQDNQIEKGYIWSMSNQPSSYWVIPDGAKKVNQMKQIRFQRNYGVFFENYQQAVAA